MIFGVRNTTSLYQKCFLKENIRPKYYTDNNESKWGKLFYNIPVLPPNELKNEKDSLFLICSANRETNDEIGMQLTDLGVY